MKTVKDYRNLYLKYDVFLLADVFIKIRNNSLKNYGLCLSHYLSALFLSWDATLILTNNALQKQRFPVRIRLLAMCRGELSVVIAQLISKCQ